MLVFQLIDDIYYQINVVEIQFLTYCRDFCRIIVYVTLKKPFN